MAINSYYFEVESSFGMSAKATGVKMTAKVVSKNSSFCFSLKNNLNNL